MRRIGALLVGCGAFIGVMLPAAPAAHADTVIQVIVTIDIPSSPPPTPPSLLTLCIESRSSGPILCPVTI